MAKSFTITLRNGGRDVSSVQMDLGCSEVVVGRSRQCALRTPESDHSVSGTHARIFWSSKSLWVEDAGSRNGVFCNGARITKPKKIASGDILSIGGSSLFCEEVKAKKVVAASLCHHLECLNGDRAGQQIEIRPNEGHATFTIGMDTANELCLPDMLVSRRHAEFFDGEEGDCWVRDLGSKNGTFVNGEVLHGKERMLKDNDKVSIAYFDFRFLDKRVPHKRFYLWLKVFAVAATLCVVAGAYVMWVTSSSTAEDYLRLARERAANRDFASARVAIDGARTARDADRYRAQIDDVEIHLERWETTAAEWDRVRNLLAAGKLMAARKALDPLTSGVLDAWVWNGTTAVKEKKAAEFAATALRIYYDSEDVLAAAGEGLPEQQADTIAAKAVPLEQFMRESSDLFGEHSYLAPLTNRLHGVFRKMKSIGTGFSKVDESIARLDSSNPDFAKLSARLGEFVKDSSLHGAIRAYADKYRQPCEELAEAKLFIRKEFEDINAMRFAAVRSRKSGLKLPSKDLCSRHPQLSDHRLKLEGYHADAQKLAANLESMVNGLSEKGVVNGACDSHLEHVLDTGSWTKALSFDCFDGKPPLTRRKDPCGFYDELLGVDYTFQSLRALPDNYNEWCLRLIGFSPDVVEARRALEYIDVFVKFVNERPAWLRRGELGAFHGYCAGLLEKKVKLLKFLDGFSGDQRARIITQFYKGFLSADFDLHSRRKLAEEFKQIQRKVGELNERYSASSDPVEQISLRTQILSVGFPGDAQLHSKWVQRYEGGAK